MLASLCTAPALGSGDLPESTQCQRRFQPPHSFLTPSLTLPGKNNPAGDREQACGSTAFLPPSTNLPLPRAHAAPGEDALVQEAEVPGSPLARHPPAWLEQNHPDPHGEISIQPSTIKGNAALGFAQCECWVKQSDSAEACPPRNPLAHITSDPRGMKSPVLTVEQDFAQQLRRQHLAMSLTRKLPPHLPVLQNAQPQVQILGAGWSLTFREGAGGTLEGSRGSFSHILCLYPSQRNP